MRATQLAHLFERRKKSLGRERNLSLRAFSSAQGQDTVHGRHGTLNSLKVHHLWSGCGHGACATRPPRKDRYRKNWAGKKERGHAHARTIGGRPVRVRSQAPALCLGGRTSLLTLGINRVTSGVVCCARKGKEPSPTERTQREAESKTNRERESETYAARRETAHHTRQRTSCWASLSACFLSCELFPANIFRMFSIIYTYLILCDQFGLSNRSDPIAGQEKRSAWRRPLVWCDGQSCRAEANP